MWIWMFYFKKSHHVEIKPNCYSRLVWSRALASQEKLSWCLGERTDLNIFLGAENSVFFTNAWKPDLEPSIVNTPLVVTPINFFNHDHLLRRDCQQLLAYSELIWWCQESYKREILLWNLHQSCIGQTRSSWKDTEKLIDSPNCMVNNGDFFILSITCSLMFCEISSIGLNQCH